MLPSALRQVGRYAGTACVVTALSACVTPQVEHHVPVVLATALLNLETAERCEYVAVGYAAEPDALVALKNLAGTSGGTLVLGFDPDLAEAVEHDAATATYKTHIAKVAGKIVRCPDVVQRDLISRATLLDTR